MTRIDRRKAISTLLVLGASLPFSVSAQQTRRNAKLFGQGGARDKYEWLPTECAHERYPMQLISGVLYSGDEKIEVPPGKIVNNGWGEIGSRRLVGEPFKPVPERLALEWFSFAEDKFFGGTVELPRAEITDLFRAGFTEPLTGKRMTWEKIIVGMGLGGWTSVWLGGAALVREVIRAQLETKEINWTRVIDNPDIQRTDYVRSKLRSRLGDTALAHLTKHGPPVSTWTRYSKRYRSRILVEGLHEPLNMYVRSFNGERSFYDLAKQPSHELDIAPKHLQITWQSRGGGKLLTRIFLDEQELFGAFDKASAAAAGTSSTNLRVGFATRSQIALSVESGVHRLPLTRSKVELRSLSS